MLFEKSVKPCEVLTAVFSVATLLIIPHAQAQQYKMETPIPPGITTPDKVDTRLGTLKFVGGYPDAETVEKVYDNLDFQRGVDVFLNSLQGASLVALRRALRETGCVDGTVGVFNTLMDSKPLFLFTKTSTNWYR